MNGLAVVVSLVSALIALAALAFARVQAVSAGASAKAAEKSARHAEEQVLISKGQFDLAEKARRDALEPYVIFDIAPSPTSSWMLECVIRNTGSTLARNVRFSFDPPLRSCDDDDNYRVADLHIIKNGLSALAPGRTVTFSFDSAYERAKSNLEKSYRVTVTADGPFGPVEPFTYNVMVSPTEDALHLQERSLHDGMKALVGIEKHIKAILGKLSAKGSQDR